MMAVPRDRLRIHGSQELEEKRFFDSGAALKTRVRCARGRGR